MSHNKIKIGTAKPNQAGELSPDLSDLNNVSSSAPSNDQYLKYNSTSSEWEPAAGADENTTSVPTIFIGEGASQTYPEAWANSNGVYFYSSSTPVNTISSATVTSSDSYANWYDTFTLPSGTYLVYARAQGDFSSSSGEFKYTVNTNGTDRAASGFSSDLSNTNQNPAIAQSVFTLSSSTATTIKISGLSNGGTVSTNQALYGFIMIQKVG
jgi:uncharacterized protein (DUF2141 family)